MVRVQHDQICIESASLKLHCLTDSFIIRIFDTPFKNVFYSCLFFEKNGQKLITCEKAVLMKVAKGFFSKSRINFRNSWDKKEEKISPNYPFLKNNSGRSFRTWWCFFPLSRWLKNFRAVAKVQRGFRIGKQSCHRWKIFSSRVSWERCERWVCLNFAAW